MRKIFESCTGGPDQAQSIIELFNKLNDGDKNQKIMADGIIANLLTTTDVNKRTLSFVLKIGTGRIKRIRDGKSKQTDCAHLNEKQVTYLTLSHCIPFIRTHAPCLSVTPSLSVSLSVMQSSFFVKLYVF
jgi:hypothetical protein